MGETEAEGTRSEVGEVRVGKKFGKSGGCRKGETGSYLA